jgi:hypothetical protein
LVTHAIWTALLSFPVCAVTFKYPNPIFIPAYLATLFVGMLG